jgi:hypothetical protein
MTYFGSYLTPWDPPRGGFEGFSQILSKGTRDSREGPSQEASQPGGSNRALYEDMALLAYGHRGLFEGYGPIGPPRGPVGAYSRDMAILTHLGHIWVIWVIWGDLGDLGHLSYLSPFDHL